jgi:hypothetical protein
LHTITEESEDFFSKRIGEFSNNSIIIDEKRSSEGINQPYLFGISRQS